jgi:hypothetical protein
MKSFKKEIRNLIEEKISELDEQLHERGNEAKKIFDSGELNWPRIGQLSDQANIILNERALLNELAGFSTKKPKELTECPL